MNKCIHQNMVMAEAVPFGQRWSYHSGHDMEEMMSPEYYKTFAGLRSGDDIRAMKLVDDEVSIFADMLVISTKPLKLHILNGPVDINAIDGLHVKQGDKCWELWSGDTLVEKYPSKPEAEKAMEFFNAA